MKKYMNAMVIMLALVACKDGGDADTGIGPETEVNTPGDAAVAWCDHTWFSLGLTDADPSKGLCTATTDIVSAGTTIEDYYSGHGINGSNRPGVSEARARRVVDGADYPTNWRTASAGTFPTEDWAFRGGINLMDCDASDPSKPDCSGSYAIDIVDGEEVGCPAYETVGLCLPLNSVGAAGSSDTDTTCAPGSGRFELTWFRRSDNDGDGLESYELLPARQSGTGTMTNQAWLTSLTVVDDGAGQDHTQALLKSIALA